MGALLAKAAIGIAGDVSGDIAKEALDLKREEFKKFFMTNLLAKQFCAGVELLFSPKGSCPKLLGEVFDEIVKIIKDKHECENIKKMSDYPGVRETLTKAGIQKLNSDQLPCLSEVVIKLISKKIESGEITLATGADEDIDCACIFTTILKNIIMAILIVLIILLIFNIGCNLTYVKPQIANFYGDTRKR